MKVAVIRLTGAPRPAVVDRVMGLTALAIFASCTWNGPSPPVAKHCAPALASAPSEPAYANTTWPTEHRDAWRTHSVAAGLPADLKGRQLKVTTAETPPTPTWGYLGTDGKVYVLGGARRCQPNGDCQLFLVVLDLETGKEIARTPVKGVKPSIGQIFIGPDNAVYYPATDTGKVNGYVNRISANPGK